MIVDRGGALSRALRTAHHAWLSGLDAALSAEGMTPERWSIVDVLRDADRGIAMTDVARRAGLPASSVTRHIDGLTQDGVVIRTPGVPDRRRIVVSLSDRGVTIADRLRAREAAALDTLRERLGVDVVETVIAALETIAAPVDEPAQPERA